MSLLIVTFEMESVFDIVSQGGPAPRFALVSFLSDIMKYFVFFSPDTLPFGNSSVSAQIFFAGLSHAQKGWEMHQGIFPSRGVYFAKLFLLSTKSDLQTFSRSYHMLRKMSTAKNAQKKPKQHQKSNATRKKTYLEPAPVTK